MHPHPRLTAVLASLALTFSLTAAAQAPFRETWDNFKGPFSVNTPDAKWYYLQVGPYVGDDGIVTTGPQGLRVIPTGVNPTTGEPAFTKTIGQDSKNGGLPGGLDHVKWLAYMNHTASTGYPGHDAVHGQRLACESWIGGRTYGTENHPFGNLVDNPNDDLRLAAFAMNTADFETFMVFDFFVTNETIYAFYERLPFGQGGPMGYYAAFSHQIPVASRTLNDKHHLKIEYDRSAGKVRWYVDDEQVFQVDQIGYRLDRQYLTLDHGGIEEPVDMRQLNCGMGTFTLLDAYRPTNVGLVKLGDVTGSYDPDVGEPTPEAFYDEESLEENRLFGQGAELTMKKYVVSSKKAKK